MKTVRPFLFMRKQLYLVTLILMVMLGVYAAYYYSNYKVQNLPVRATVSGMTNTVLLDYLDQKTCEDTNMLYTALRPGTSASSQAFSNGRNTPKDTAFANLNLVYRSGTFNDSTLGYIRRAESRHFKDNYNHNPGFNDGETYVFSHIHVKQIFQKNFRYHRSYLPFKNARVKALTYLPGRPSPGAYHVRFYPDAEAFRHLAVIHRKDSSRLVFGLPKRSGNALVGNLFEAAEKTILNNKGVKPTKDDAFTIPMLDFQLKHHYRQPPSEKGGVSTAGYTQLTLITNTQYNVLQRDRAQPQKGRKILFDEPFLFYYQPEGSHREKPVLLGWFAQPSLLLRQGKRS